MAHNNNVTFDLGPSYGLLRRSVVITRMHRAGDDVTPTAEYSNTALDSATRYLTVALPINTIWSMILQDTTAQSVLCTPKVFLFDTGSLGNPGKAHESGYPIVIVSEDMSSSSSSNSSSSSSSNSSSSSSPSSSQSSSSSSSNSSSSSSSSSSS